MKGAVKLVGTAMKSDSPTPFGRILLASRVQLLSLWKRAAAMRWHGTGLGLPVVVELEGSAVWVRADDLPSAIGGLANDA